METRNGFEPAESENQTVLETGGALEELEDGYPSVAEEEPDAAYQPEQQPAALPKIFISHRRGFDLDETIASLLSNDLRNEGNESSNRKSYDVYLDLERPGTEPYNDAIKNTIEEACVVIALISEQANQGNANWIMYELEYAYRCWEQSGNRNPRLLPIHLEPIGALQPRLGAVLAGFQRIDYSGDNVELIRQVRDAINEEYVPPPKIIPLDAFLVGDSRTSLVRAAFLESSQLENAARLLERDKLLWIVGDASVRNYVALSLAVKQQAADSEGEGEEKPARKIYEVTKSIRWSKVYNSLISGSIIIFSDVVPTALFDEEVRSNELRSLQQLVERNNIIIVTTSPDYYLEIQQEMRKREFRLGEEIEVTHDFYNERDKVTIFEKLLVFSEATNNISAKQLEWAQAGKSSESFRSNIKKWSPADIERFITRHLRLVKKASDIPKLLQRNADLDNEIHAWFVSLDDSTRCFVMALALFSELHKEHLWTKYKEIVETLQHLDTRLSLWPLGICRERAALYVTNEGPIDFTEERIADAIHRELAKNYREYFIELLPLLQQWSVPPGRNGNRAVAISPERKRQAAEGRQVRDAIARMVGKMGQYGFDDLSGLLEYWAIDPLHKVREAVAVSLQQAAAESSGSKHVFSILDGWCADRTSGEETLFKTFAAAGALGSIVAANPGRPIYDEARRRLERLARDARSSIRFFVSIPLKKIARKAPLSSIEPLLNLVVQDRQARINVAEALNEARLMDEAAAMPILNTWLNSEDRNQRWAAVCSIVLWGVSRRQSGRTGQVDIVQFVHHDAEMVAAIFVQIVGQKYYRKKALALFEKMALEIPEDARRELVAGMAKVPFGLLDESLLTRLRTSAQPRLQNMIIEVREERWRRLLSTPNTFTDDLREELNQTGMTVEVYTALTILMKPEPEGSRRQLIESLVAGFTQDRGGLNDVLAKLKTIAPAMFDPFAVEVRCEILRQFFHKPVTFVEMIIADLGNPESADDMQRVLGILTLPEPEGSQEEVLQALASCYALEPATVESLLNLFRVTSPALRVIAYDFELRLFEGLLAEPQQFFQKAVEATRDANQWEEVVQVIRRLAVSEPRGQRARLVKALAQVRDTQRQEVDAFLQHPSLKTHLDLAGLRLEVKLASLLSNDFVPKFLSGLFRPTH